MSEMLLAIIGDLEVERRKLLGQLDAAQTENASLRAQLAADEPTTEET